MEVFTVASQPVQTIQGRPPTEMTKGVLIVILAVTLLINVTAKDIPQRRDEIECPVSSTPLPECPDPANDPGYTFFPHSDSCEFFYHCYQGVPKCKKCPQGLVWNSDLDTCDWPWNVNCEVRKESRRNNLLRDVCPEIGGILPPCPFPDHQESTYHAHPADCQWFYQCSNGIPYCQPCPVNLHWNAELEVCDYPYRANCGSSGTSAPTTPNNEDSTTVASSEQPGSSTAKPCPAGRAPDCPFPDPELSVFFPHENECHWFYHCSNGVAYCKECPADLHWNVKLETCDYPYRAGCKIGPPSNSSTAAPPPATTEENSSPSDPATDTTEAPNPTESTTTSSATPLCPAGNAPQCPFPDPEHLVFFPHENDCEWFYQCANGVAHCKQCPQGLHWNNQKQICDYPENAGCTSGNPSTPTATTTEDNSATDTEAPSTKTPVPTESTSAPRLCPQGPVPDCPFPDPELSVFFPHENDCHWFYHCSNGVAYCKECPADLHWNVKLETCDYPYRAGCKIGPPSNSSTAAPPPATTEENSSPDPTTEAPNPTESSTTSSATPLCPAGNVPQCPFPDPEHLVFFPHENDCEWFYQCANGVAHCKQCPQGLHWNNQKQICDYPENAGCASGTPSTPEITTGENTTPDPATDTEAPSSESPNPTQSTSSPIQQCPTGHVPACPFPDPDFSVFFPHENDCHWFYHCSNGVAYCKECPADLHWNVKLETCDYPYRAGCKIGPPSNSSTAAPPPATTEENSSPSDPATDTTEAPNPTESTTTSSATPLCPAGNAPQCPFPDPEHLVFFPHENDCEWFYQCANGVAHCKQCPQGLHWNNQKQICDYPENAGCTSGNPSTPTPTTTEDNSATDTEAPSTKTPVPTESTSAPRLCPQGPVPDCPFPDPELSVFFPHENDCHWFYHCSNGVAYCKECPADLHWNVKLETCDYPYRAGCKIGPPSNSSTAAPPPATTEENSSPSDPATDTTEAPNPTESTTTSSATPLCPAGNAPQCPFPDPEHLVFFPHENDCEWFYQCANGVAHCKQCPQGLHWNNQKQICDYPENAGCASGTPSTPEITTGENTTPDPATDTEAPSSESPNPTQSTSSPIQQCPTGHVPACPFPDPDFSVFFPHENDCHWFYHCSNGVAYCKRCPAGLHWNAKLDTCDYPYRAGCANIPPPESSSSPTPPESTSQDNSSPSEEPTEAPSTESTQSTTAPCPLGNMPICPFPDPELSVFFPHQNDCHWFYHCSNGVAYCKECPADLHWNARLETCDYPYRAGCSAASKLQKLH